MDAAQVPVSSEAEMSANPHPATQSLARSRPGLLLVSLMTGPMCISLGLVACMASLPQIAQDFGSRGTFIAQMMISVVAFGLMLGAAVSGWILARLGTRGTYIACALVFGLAGAGGMFLSNPNLLLASRFLTGFAAVVLSTTCFWVIGTEYDEQRRARAFGLATASSNATSIVAVTVGAVLAQLGGWRLSFVQYPIFGCLIVLLGLLALRQAKPGSQGGAQPRAPFFWRLLPFYLLAALLFLILFMASTQFVFLLQADGVTIPTVRSIFLSTYTVFGALTGLAYGPIQRRLSMTGAFALGLASMTVALAVLGWSRNPAGAAAGSVLIGVFIGIIATYINQFVAQQTDTASRGHALGLLMMFCYLGGFLNPPVLTPLTRMIGLRNVFLAAALVMAVITVGAAAHLRRLRIPQPATK
jgi:MFS transporter, ACDE family, multidrug resistance protein